MGRNRVLGGGLHIDTVTSSTKVWWTTDQYHVNAAAGSPVTMTLNPEVQDGDQVVILDAGNNAAFQPITILTSSDKPFVGGGTSTQIASNGGALQFTYSIDLGGYQVAPVEYYISGPPPLISGQYWEITGDASTFFPRSLR